MSNDISDDTRRWDTFIGWVRRFFESDEYFDEYWADGTFELAIRLRLLRDALEQDERFWLGTLHLAFEPKVNVLSTTVKESFAAWCEAHRGEARRALLRLWDSEAAISLSDRVDRFTDEVGWPVVADARKGASLASCLLTMLNFSSYPVYGAKVYEHAYWLTGYPSQPTHGCGAIYCHALDFLDRLLQEARRRGLPLDDRLDAYCAMWCVAQPEVPVSKPPVSKWPKQDHERLVEYHYTGSSTEAETDEGGRDSEQAPWTVQYERGTYDLGTPIMPPDVDARTRVVAEVIRRQGQPEFRQQVLDAYDSRCAVTDCDAVEALEAAHIAPYHGPHTNSVTNGLLLRADIHTLFDLGLLAIDTATMTVLLAPSLTGTTYAPLAGQRLRLPTDTALRPDIAALDEHRRRSSL